MTIGQKIRNSREDHDLKQSDMADLIPMNQSSYSKIERDVQEPSMEQLKRICEILSLDPRYLLELDNFKFVAPNIIVISPEDRKILDDAKAFIEKHK